MVRPPAPLPPPLPPPPSPPPASGGDRPRPLERLATASLLGGQVLWRLLRGHFHHRQLMGHLITTGPGAFRAVLVINGLAGMIFTIQTAREMLRFGALEGVGGAFALAFCRELAPLLTASIVAGQVGAAFAAELGAMRVTEQIDALLILRTDPVDYLVTPRVVATVCMLPILTLFAMVVGIAGGTAIAAALYDQSPSVFLGAVRLFLTPGDIFAVLLKAVVFGFLIAVLGCSWGLTTWGGAKGVGQSATTAVVTIWFSIFLADLVLSLLLFGTSP